MYYVKLNWETSISTDLSIDNVSFWLKFIKTIAPKVEVSVIRKSMEFISKKAYLIYIKQHANGFLNKNVCSVNI